MRKSRFIETQMSRFSGGTMPAVRVSSAHADAASRRLIVNHKRVHRIYRAHGLELWPRRKRGVRYVRGNVASPVSHPNER
jgi:hypothetical protein